RRALSVFNTILDSGWYGYATLELINHGRASLVILAGDPIGQVVCHLLTEPTTQPYSGKYQDQEAGPQPARDEGLMATVLPDDVEPTILDTPIHEFDAWSVRVANCFHREGIKTVGDLVRKTRRELMASSNFGRASLVEVKEALERAG